MLPRILSVGMALLLFVGCGQQAERRCLDNDSCRGTAEITVCWQGSCVPKVCELEATQPCYNGPEGTKGQGECRTGLQLCIHNGSDWSSCIGERLPQKEVCDQQDNNCDGQTDETLSCSCKEGESRLCWPRGASAPEAQQSLCRKGIQYCSSQKTWGPCQGALEPLARFHQLQSNTSTQAQASQELQGCINNDRDCDGQLDTNLECSCKPDTTRPCYTGPPGTRNQGSCKEGVQRCIQVSGQTWRWGFCEKQQLPTLEETHGCNNKDDDCDGHIDNQSSTSAPLWKPCSSPSSSCSIQLCKKGQWGLCEQVELCGNTIDDNCDGSVDEVACEMAAKSKTQ